MAAAYGPASQPTGSTTATGIPCCTTPQDVRRNRWYRPRKNYGGECLGVYYPRLVRDGWTLVKREKLSKWNHQDIFEKPMGQGWILRKIAHAQCDAPASNGCYWDETRTGSHNNRRPHCMPEMGMGRSRRQTIGLDDRWHLEQRPDRRRRIVAPDRTVRFQRDGIYAQIKRAILTLDVVSKTALGLPRSVLFA